MHCITIVFVCRKEVFEKHFKMSLRGVAWSNSQPRRLPLQGSVDRILVFSFFYLFPNNFSQEERKTTKGSRKWDDRNAGAAKWRRRTGRRFWNDYEKGIRWFELATRLNGQRHLLADRHGEKIITCCYRSSVVHRTIHMKNDNWTTINKRTTGEVAR